MTYQVHCVHVIPVSSDLVDGELACGVVIHSLFFLLEKPDLLYPHLFLKLPLMAIPGIEQLAGLFGRNICQLLGSLLLVGQPLDTIL